MGGAILRALLDSAGDAFDRYVTYDPNEDKRSDFSPAEPMTSAEAATRAADVILLAVKPQKMPGVLDEIAGVAGGKLFVSVAAGTTSASIEAKLPGARVVRTMPNTPLLAGRGVVGIAGGVTATADDIATTKQIFQAAKQFDIGEVQMDALTAVSGSGPAYFFYVVECLAAAAEAEGFDSQTAYDLASATFTGAAALLESSGASAGELRQRVTSPGGTTAAGLSALQDGGLDALLKSTVSRAAARGRELGRD